MDVPSEKTIKKKLKEDPIKSDYIQLLDTEVESKGIGRSTVVLYLICGGRRNIIEARRLGGAIGLTTKIVDDLLDGENIKPVRNKREFLRNYLQSFENGSIPDPVEKKEEIYAYRSGEILYGFFMKFPDTHNLLVNTLHEMAALVETEDKSKVEPYREYVKAAGGLHGRLLIEALTVFDDFNMTKTRKEFGFAFGKALQIGDDIVDQDVHLEDGDLHQEFERSKRELKSFGYRSVYLLTLLRPKDLRKLIVIEKKIKEYLKN